MIRKVFKTGNSLVVSLPGKAIEVLGLHEGSELNVEVEADKGRIILSPLALPITDIDATFARQLAEFIEQYRPALAALAR
jgi:antitoxin component of MazEF toxin-antitoxin module